VAQFLITIVNLVVTIITIILILNALISWAPIEPWHPVRRFLNQLAEPIVRPFRSIVPPVGMFDLSLLVALIVVQLIGRLLTVLLASL
jgi:YggT family protein